MTLYQQLNRIQSKPGLFSVYTADVLWTQPHLANQMLKTHLDQNTALASRPVDTIDHMVGWLDDRFDLKGKSICDLGCGPGLYAKRFAACGAKVHGLDFSSNSIAYARQNAAGDTIPITYEVANYLDDAIPENQDLVTLIYCDLCPLSPLQRRRLYSQIRQSLKPDGVFVFDVVSMHAFAGVEETSVFARNYMGGFWSASDYFTFHNTFRYEAEAVSLDHFTIIEAERTWQVYNWLQHFSPDSIQQELAENAFEVVEILNGFGSENSKETTFGVIAKPKP